MPANMSTNQDLKQWDIVKVHVQPNDRDEHPAIILSPTEALSAFARVCVFYGTTKRPAKNIEPGQILLNGSDGLDHLTVFDTLQIYMVSKTSITQKISEVSHVRRAALKRLIISTYRLL